MGVVERSVVRHPSPDQLPDAFDRVEPRAVRRNEKRFEVILGPPPPTFLQKGMAIPGTISDEDLLPIV